MKIKYSSYYNFIFLAFWVSSAISADINYGSDNNYGAAHYLNNPQQYSGRSIYLNVVDVNSVGQSADIKPGYKYVDIMTVQGNIRGLVPNESLDSFINKHKNVFNVAQGSYNLGNYKNPPKYLSGTLEMIGTRYYLVINK
jgi:hypothetical protein